MRFQIALIVMAMTMAGCSSTGTMTSQHDPAKPRSVFIEPFPTEYNDYPELYEYAGIALARRGYDATKEAGASYRLKSSLDWKFTSIALAVRLVDIQTGQIVYFGECNDYGLASAVSSRGAMAQCFKDALEQLK